MKLELWVRIMSRENAVGSDGALCTMKGSSNLGRPVKTNAVAAVTHFISQLYP